MKVTVRCLSPNGCTQEVVIDGCCQISIDPPPPPPGLSFDFQAPGGEASGAGYSLSRELKTFEQYNTSLEELTPVGAVPYISPTTYGYVDDQHLTLPECAPGEYPAAELFSNGVWHTTVFFLRNAAGQIYLVPAYGAVNLPLETTRISLGLPACTFTNQ